MPRVLLVFLLLARGTRAQCSAAPGAFCVDATTQAPCPAGSFCTGGAAPPLPCTCPALCPVSTAADAENFVWTASTLAGSGATGFADGIGTNATFGSPNGGAADSRGNFYVGDQPNCIVRKVVLQTGLVTTLAGKAGNCTGTDGVGSSATFKAPRGCEWNPSTDDVYVADTTFNKIRVISQPDLVVTVLAGSGVAGAADGVGVAATFNGPSGLAYFAPSNVLYVVGNHMVRAIDVASATVTTLAGSPTAGFADNVGALASFNGPFDANCDSSGNVIVADWKTFRIRKVTPTGVVTTVVGTGSSGAVNGPTSVASLVGAVTVLPLANGALVISDWDGDRVRFFSTTGYLSTMAGPAEFNLPCAATANVSTGTITINDHGSRRIRQLTCSACPVGSFCVNGAPTPCAAGFFGATSPQSTSACSGPCTAAPGAFCAAGSTNASGAPCPAGFTCAGGSAPPVPCACGPFCGAGLAVDPLPEPVWVSAPLSGLVNATAFQDGSGSAARFVAPRGMCTDASGSAIVADETRVRVVAPNGTVWTLSGAGTAGMVDGAMGVARFGRTNGVACASNGLVYVSDVINNRIRAIVRFRT